MSDLKLYRFNQNNSGGYYFRNNDFDKTVIILSRDETSAINTLDNLGGFDLPYCECCGPRFSEYGAYDEYDIVDLFEIYFGTTVRFHYRGKVYCDISTLIEALRGDMLEVLKR